MRLPRNQAEVLEMAAKGAWKGTKMGGSLGWKTSKAAMGLGAKGAEVGSNLAMKGAKKVFGMLEKSHAERMSKPFSAMGTLKSGAGHLAGLAGFSALTYGLIGIAERNPDNNAADNMLHTGKMVGAAAVDTAAFAGVDALASTVGLLGPWGMIAGGAMHAGMMAMMFTGNDPASLFVKGVDAATSQYDAYKAGPQFNMTSSSAQTLQRHLGSLQSAGSNIAELMHN